MPDRRHQFPCILRDKGLPPPDDETMQGLLDIVDEGTLGATNHVAIALPLVARLAAAPRPSALAEALELARFIAATRGAGAPIVANALRWQTEGAGSMTPEAGAALLRDRAAAWGDAAAERRAALIRQGVEVLAGCARPLIYDYSSTVADLVRALAATGALEAIVIPESRAIDGGRRYMTALSDLGVAIAFLPDTAIEHAMATANAVLLGAESVTLDGGISNTIGSIAAARAAQAHGVPVYGAADLFKVGGSLAADTPAPPRRRYDFLLKDGETATTEAPELEVVPPALVTAILTERGAVAPADLAAVRSQNVA